MKQMIDLHFQNFIVDLKITRATGYVLYTRTINFTDLSKIIKFNLRKVNALGRNP